MQKGTGRLFLVSVGIGDCDNMTIRARKTIEQADIVLAMAFIGEQYADVLSGKEVHDAGHALFTTLHAAKSGDEERVRHIVREAFSAGKTIAVLDFGDPTLYSPQSGYLKEFADLNPQIIPGISSFNAANAVLKKELSGLYDHAVILTETRDVEQLEQLAATRSTMVLFTMRMDLPAVISMLQRHYPGSTPVALVVNAGFSAKEQVVHATLETIIAQVEKEPPAWAHLIYIGDFLR
ncbi:MAG: hypothetical protein BCS36_09650 [Desulfovibrio sp. MES5]|uniref:SAM-dependent methyltransferase n=1 Tax=Desulfovibrio sp. MES5 TaxID=1899016 RepID=UPI000B9D0998|nr:SAM-dependent methyltransferase [Desulfovibrio sp. MES5]OXS28377.1 MAG: hypothetical protein BCS36_09650 [Desulfovibrio sp. MES5]